MIKPIKKWSKFIAWAMRDIRRDIRPKVYAFHNDPQRKTYVAIGERHRSLYIIAFTEVVTKKKGDYKVVNGLLGSLTYKKFNELNDEYKYRKFRGRALDQIIARTPRSIIKLHIALCIEQSQPVVEFEDGSKIEAKRIEHFDLLKSRTKINEILIDYLT